jgi:hypothetical protein
MMNAKQFYLAVAASVVCMSATATPVTMTFDSLTAAGTGWTSIERNISPTQSGYSENGFQVTTGGTSGPVGFGSAHTGQTDYYFGTTSLFNDNTAGGITTLSQIDGGAFALSSMLLAAMNNTWTFTPNQEYVTFTGNIDGGGIVTQSVLLLNNTSFQLVDFIGFTDVNSVTWVQSAAGSNGLSQFANIVLDDAITVPEPASVALIGMGLAGLFGGVFMRRRKQPSRAAGAVSAVVA